MQASTAWILDFQGGYRAAVGEFEMVHLIQSPTLVNIPQTPFYCRDVLIWQGWILPVMNLGAWLEGSAMESQQLLTGVFVYQQNTNSDPKYGALLITNVPRRIQVSDQQACDLPKQPRGWRQLAVSCFKDSNMTVPILNLPSIFSKDLLR